METLTIPTRDGAAEAWAVRPDGNSADNPHRAVLFCMDLNALRPQTQSMIERIASWGFVVVAPNTLYRSGSIDEVRLNRDLLTPGEREQWQAEAMPRLKELTADAVRSDVAAYVAATQTLVGVKDEPIGVTGYCMGARIALITACEVPDQVAAASGWHGAALVTDAEDSAHRMLGDHVTAAFAFGHAADDALNPAEAITALGEALVAAGVTATNETFPGPHAYTMKDTLNYREEADQMHWMRLERLLKTHLK